MKLLFVAPTGSLTGGGGELSHYEMIIAAKKRGHDVHVVVPAKDTFYKELRTKGIGCTVVEYFWWGTFSSKNETPINMAAVGKLSKLANKLKTDCIITNSLNIPWGALAAAIADVPHVWVSREMALRQFRYLEDHYDFIKNYSNAVLANSRTNAKFIEQRTKRKTSFFYPYVDTSKIKLNTSLKETRLVNVGSLQPGKNQLELVNAAGALNRKGILSSKVVLVGPQWDKRYADKLSVAIKNHNLQGKVHLTGFKKNPYESVGPNDIFVQTSDHESFGRTTIEAMKLGLVTIMADSPVTKEVISLGGGLTYEAGNPGSLAKTLSRVMEDPERYKKEARKTSKKTLSNLNEAACHDSFFQTLEKVHKQPNPRRELRHIAFQLEGAVEVTEDYEKITTSQEKIISGYERDLNNILNSKSWKAVQNAKKIIGR